MQNAILLPKKGVSPKLAKVTRLRLHDTVVEYLRNFIVEGVLSPGTKLNERELCETLGISRTPLREAIKVLAAEGLVDIIPNRGATVTQLSELEVREMFEVMSGLEAFSGLLACERITAEELAEIEAMHYTMLACHAKGDLPGYYTKNHQIHDHINQASRNNTLREIYLSVNRRLEALRFRSNFSATKWDKAIQEHSKMIDALKARDGERLSQILRLHLLEKRDAVLKLLKAEGGDHQPEGPDEADGTT
ncbi:MAG: GntR family transcriptional regulator [Alcaligenaceae bacterium]|nr:GntR family transcriptional regulator [Alcaligenaceae bacterium]